jgi:hypothetical protein
VRGKRASIDQYIGVGEYEMVNVEKINTIKVDEQYEEHFKQLPIGKQQEVLEGLKGGPMSNNCEEKMSIYL